jgi:lipoprotein-anchoring transpeptidase ErfK/SrfK
MISPTIRLVRGTVVAFAICAAPVYSAAAKAPASAKTAATAKKASLDKAAAAAKAALPIEERAAGLKPGHWVWQPDRSAEGEVEIVVSLPLQIAYIYRGGTLIGATTVSTGQPGKDTPTGRFSILQKREKHFSNLYDNAPMPFMQRLTWDGVALHAGAIPGYPASHGCIRLPPKLAAKLYAATHLGATVVIVDEAPSAEAAYAMLTGETFQTAMGGPEEPVPAEEEPAVTLAAGE